MYYKDCGNNHQGYHPDLEVQGHGTVEYYTAWDSWGINFVIGAIQIMIYLGALPILLLSQDVIIPTDVMIKILIGIQTMMVIMTIMRVRGYYISNILKIWLGHFVSLAILLIISYGIILYTNKYSIMEYGIVQLLREIYSILGAGILIRFAIVLGTKMFVELFVHLILYIMVILDEGKLVANKETTKKDKRFVFRRKGKGSNAIATSCENHSVGHKMYEEYSNTHTIYMGEWME